MGEVGTPVDPQAAVGVGDRYVLLRQVGTGAMGTVHEAHDTLLDRRVAVKLIDRRLATDPVFHRRFANEAAILARLDGRTIVRVYDVGTTPDGLFLVTQYLPDGDLGSWLRQHGPLSPRRAALVTADVCDALEQAHLAGIVHRDVKPGNVLLRVAGDGLEGYLADFGIARPDDSELTNTGEVLGTPAYMAPERHLGDGASPAGDLYAAGCVLWCALTGRRPYDGTPHQQATGHLEGPVPQLGGTEPWQRRLDEVLRRALAKDPAGRFPDCASMAAALRAVAADAPDDAEAVAAPDRAVRRVRRPAATALVATLVIAAAAVGGWAWWAHGRSAPPTTVPQWRCADGSTVDARSACALPSGAADIDLVLPGARRCSPVAVHHDQRVYAARCRVAGADGYGVTYSAWSTRRDGLEHYLSVAGGFSQHGVRPTTWTQHGERAGLTWEVHGALDKVSFLYDDVPYSVSVTSSSEQGLAAGVAAVGAGGANPPSAFLPQQVD